MEDIQTTSSQTVFKTGEKINITWTPNQLTEDILSGDGTVDIAMVCMMHLSIPYIISLVCRDCIILIQTHGRLIFP